MKNLFLLCALLLLNTPGYSAELVVNVMGAVSNGGLLKLGLFDKAEAFPGGKPTYGLNVEAETGNVTVTFNDLSTGRYALAVFQDSNNNQKLDTNFFGIPSELYGFSRAEKAGQPKFEDAAFELPEEGATITVQLR